MVAIGTLAFVGFAKSTTIFHYPSSAKRILTPLSSLSENPSPARVRDAIVWLVNNNGGDEKMMDDMLSIAFCESSFNVKAYNPKDSDGTPSIGLYQFKERTFYYFAEKYKIQNPDILNPAQQIELTYKMFDDGYKHLWGCWK